MHTVLILHHPGPGIGAAGCRLINVSAFYLSQNQNRHPGQGYGIADKRLVLPGGAHLVALIGPNEMRCVLPSSRDIERTGPLHTPASSPMR